MNKEKLENLLNELLAELDRAESVDEELRAALRRSASEIRERLARGEGQGADGSVLERLNDAVVQFEGSHPALALAITQVINALVDIGV